LGTRGVKGIYTVAGQSGGGRGGGPVDTIGVNLYRAAALPRSRAVEADHGPTCASAWKICQASFAELQEQQSGPGGGKDIQIEIGSDNYPVLDKIVDGVRRHLDVMQGVRDVEDSRPLPGIEWALNIDREQAGRFGADIGTVGAAVQLVTNGIKVGNLPPR